MVLVRRIGSAFVSAAAACLLTLPSVVAAPSIPLPDKALVRGAQWQLAAVRAALAWTVTRGAGVKVAVVDTGVDAMHPDLAGRLLDGARIVAPAGGSKVATIVPVPAARSVDYFGHGTQVAGIVAASGAASGVAPEARIISVELFDAVMSATSVEALGAVIAAGVRAAVARGADVINVSLGLPSPETLTGASAAQWRAARAQVCSAVAKATEAGAVVVGSSGNDGPEENYALWPSDCPTAVSVAASTADGRVADFSTADSTVAVAAPGQDVPSTTPIDYSPFPWELMSGTSMSSPVVAGLAALYAAAHPGASPAQTRAALIASARDIGARGWDPRSGAGVPDAAVLVGAAAVPDVGSVAQPAAFMRVSPPVSGATGESFVVRWSLSDAVADVIGFTLLVRENGRPVRTLDLPATAVRHTVTGLRGIAAVELVARTVAGDVRALPVVAEVESAYFVERGGYKPTIKLVRTSASVVRVEFSNPRLARLTGSDLKRTTEVCLGGRTEWEGCERPVSVPGLSGHVSLKMAAGTWQPAYTVWVSQRVESASRGEAWVGAASGTTVYGGLSYLGQYPLARNQTVLAVRPAKGMSFRMCGRSQCAGRSIKLSVRYGRGPAVIMSSTANLHGVGFLLVNPRPGRVSTVLVQPVSVKGPKLPVQRLSWATSGALILR